MDKWWSATLWCSFIEFLAVFFQLFCYSRVGSLDLFASALVLYATLVVFDFPFLNPYLFWFIRLGPSWKFSRGAAIQCVFVVACQCLGAGSAAAASYAARTPDDTAIRSGAGWDNGFIFLEELLAVCAFLMGMVHVLRCEIPEILENAERADNTLPIKAIMYVSVLVAGLSRAFPSAHFGLHISVFMLARGVKNAEFRVLGGCVGTLIAIICFHLSKPRAKEGAASPSVFFEKIARLR